MFAMQVLDMYRKYNVVPFMESDIQTSEQLLQVRELFGLTRCSSPMADIHNADHSPNMNHVDRPLVKKRRRDSNTQQAT